MNEKNISEDNEFILETPTEKPMVSIVSDKNRIVFIILALFLGSFGIHNFYIGRTGIAFMQLCMILFTCGIAVAIVVPWNILEIFIITKDGANKPLR